MNNVAYTYNRILFSILKRKEIPAHATTRMNPEDIMLHETSQSQEGFYHSTYMRYLDLPSLLGHKVVNQLPGLGGGSMGRYCSMGMGFSFGMIKFWKRTVMMVAQRYEWN